MISPHKRTEQIANKPRIPVLNPARLISVSSVATLATGRTLLAIQSLNHDAASADRGASVEEIKQLDRPPEGVIPPDRYMESSHTIRRPNEIAL